MCNVETGETTSLLRGMWFYARSDRLLQPFSEATAERLSAALVAARGTDMTSWNFDAGDGRTISTALGGGLVQKSSGGTLRLVTRLYMTDTRAYAVLRAPELLVLGSQCQKQGLVCDQEQGSEETFEPLLSVPAGTGAMWFYSRDDRTWVPYGPAACSVLELAYQRGAGACIGGGRRWMGGDGVGAEGSWVELLVPDQDGEEVRYVVSLDEGLQVNQRTGIFRRITRSSWFWQRSDTVLQPLPPAVDAAVEKRCAAGWNKMRTSVAVDSDRVITAGVLGGLVQVRKGTNRCRFVTNTFQTVPFGVQVTSLHPMYREETAFQQAMEILNFKLSVQQSVSSSEEDAWEHALKMMDQAHLLALKQQQDSLRRDEEQTRQREQEEQREKSLREEREQELERARVEWERCEEVARLAREKEEVEREIESKARLEREKTKRKQVLEERRKQLELQRAARAVAREEQEQQIKAREKRDLEASAALL